MRIWHAVADCVINRNDFLNRDILSHAAIFNVFGCYSVRKQTSITGHSYIKIFLQWNFVTFDIYFSDGILEWQNNATMIYYMYLIEEQYLKLHALQHSLFYSTCHFNSRI